MDTDKPDITATHTVGEQLIILENECKALLDEVEQLRAKARMFEQVTNSLPHVVYLFDTKSRNLHYVSRALQSLLGYSAQSLIERGPDYLRTLVHPDDLPVYDRIAVRLKYAQDGQTIETKYRLKHENGEYRWLLARDAVFERDIENRVKTIVGMVEDITDQIRLEEDNLRREKELLESQKLESLGLLAGGIAHDFNNILMGILGHAALAKRATDPSTASGHIERIERTAQRASELTRQLLAYAGRGVVTFREIDFVLLVNDMVGLVRVGVSKLASLQIECKGKIPRIEGDAAQLQQVVMNLLTNAAEALGGRAGRIYVRIFERELTRDHTKTAQLDATAGVGSYVVLEVEDTGTGMPDATLARIFDPFFSTKGSGRGLGLAAIHGIVRSHRGAIWVRSVHGEGTIFRVAFPSSRVAPDSIPRVRAVEPPPPVRTKLVLIVDDDPVVRAVTMGFLRTEGARVIEAVDGKDAIKIFSERKNEIDLILLDIEMPEIRGDDVLETIHALRPDIKVLLMSGHDEQDIASKAKTLSGGFLPKPFSAPQLFAALRTLFDGAT